MTETDDLSAVLSLENVTRKYESGKSTLTALDRISLTCRRGSWTAIMGPSGSGKSTLLNCAAGLDTPDAGDILIGGRNVSSLGDDALTKLRRTDIGFVFQQFNLISALTATQNVSLPLRLAGIDDADRLAREALTSLGLSAHTHHKPRELSGGQQQRVAIARAVVAQPDILFADEPTGALDSQSAHSVLVLLRTLVEQQRQTILMVTHDPQAAASADRVVFLHDGRVITTLNGADTRRIASTLADLETHR